jgi:hypothetical protein
VRSRQVDHTPQSPHSRPARLIRKLLWVDCIAAALAGFAVLTLSGWLSSLYALPEELLLFTGAINLLYGCYSFTLATRATRPRSLIYLLVFANLLWTAVCLGLAALFGGSASLFGMGHLVGEAVFVGTLASLEWKYRDQMITASRQGHAGILQG